MAQQDQHKSSAQSKSNTITPQTASSVDLGTATGSSGNRWVADMCLFATAAMWGINIPVFKHVLVVLDPWVFNALRLVMASISLGILVAIESRFIPRRTERLPIGRAILFSIMAGILYQLAFVAGMEKTTSGNTALLLSSMPMWTAILSYFFLRERLPTMTWVGLFVTFCGTAIVTIQGGSVNFSNTYVQGNAYILLAAITWAAATVYSRPILQTITPLQLAFISSLVSTPFHLLLAWNEIPKNWHIAISVPTIFEMAYSGIFSTGIAYATWHMGVRRVGGSHAAVYQNVVTLVAVLGGWIFLKEQPNVVQIIGGALIIVGLFAMRCSRRHD